MKTLLSLLTFLFVLSPNVVLSENWYDLVERDGLWYKKFSNVRFSGEVTGQRQGTIKNGKKEGAWFYYYRNGQLEWKETFKNGKWDGLRVTYHENGKISSKQTFKDGKRVSPLVIYDQNGWKVSD